MKMASLLKLGTTLLVAQTAAALIAFAPAPVAAQENVSSSGAQRSALTPAQAAALDEWTYSLALQTANWGAPLVTMYLLRYHDAVGPNAKAAPNSIWRMEDVSTPALSQQAGYVTPNVNVIYGFGFVDLTQEPVILSVPDSKGLYYVVEIVDMYTNAFAYAAGKATGYGGGDFALVGPGWSGRLPDGVKRIDCPTPWVLLQPRVHLFDNGVENLARAKSMLDAITVTGLAKFSGETPVKPPTYNYAAPQLTDPNLPVSALDFKDPLQFWELFSAAMNENPPPRDQINAVLPSFKTLGIELGKQWDRTIVRA
jgi:DNA sulfur modification protein DndE